MMIFAFLAIAQTRPETAFRAAIETETVKGDLMAAIEQYKRIAQGSDRSLAARALVRMAECYRKLGHGEAETIYSRVVRDYADQAESTVEARKGLAGLRSAAPFNGVTKRRLWAGCDVEYARISTDGRWMVGGDWCNTGDLAIRDMASGQVRRLMVKPDSERESRTWAHEPLLSPDARQIVYLWEDGSGVPSKVQLRILTNEAAGKVRVLLDKPEYGWYHPCAWSRDGRSLLAVLQRRDRTWELAWISIDDGTVKSIKSLHWRLYNTDARPRLSPDGRQIAYNALSPSDGMQIPPQSTEQRIYVLSSDGSSETEVVKMAGVHNPIWSPDGNHLLFTSDRSGAVGLWSLRMRDGKPVAAPAPVLGDLGKLAAWGMSDSGTYYYSRDRTRVGAISIMSWSFDRVPAEKQVAVKSVDLAGSRPSWSRDGKSLAFTRPGPSAKDGLDLVVHSLETASETIYELEGIAARPLQWLHSGKGILVLTLNPGRKPALYQVDLPTKSIRKVFEFDPPVRMPGQFQIASDDNTLYVSARSDNLNQPDVVYSLNMAAKELKPIASTFTARGSLLVLRLSPDERTIAIRWRDPSERKVHISRVSVGGADHRELYASSRQVDFEVLEWTADGRDILFDDLEGTSWRIMRIPAAGGEAVFTGLTGMGRLQTLSINPVSSHVALFTPTAVAEHWSIENLAPLLK